MSTQSTKKQVFKDLLSIQINFFQDFFGLIEEIVKNGPGVGLPEDFKIDGSIKKKLLKWQKKINIPEELILRRNNFKKIMDSDYLLIEKLEREYEEYWKARKEYLYKAQKFIKKFWSKKYFHSINKIEKITRQKYKRKKIPVFLVMSYKTAGTCDEYTKVIRLGVTKMGEFLLRTIVHEIIHYHVRSSLKVNSTQEELITRAIEAEVLQNDLKNLSKVPHWKATLNKKGIKYITKLRKAIKKSGLKIQEAYKNITEEEQEIYDLEKLNKIGIKI